MGSIGDAAVSANLRDVASRHPRRVAVEAGGVMITYAELDLLVDRLAARLVADLGLGDHRIALRTSGAIPTVVGTLGIRRAGMVSVSIDPTAPIERVRAALVDVDAALMLTDVVVDTQVDGESGGIATPTADPLTHHADPPDGGIEQDQGPLASITFTSGSTGTPKGIMVSRQYFPILITPLSDVATEGDDRRFALMAPGSSGFTEPIMHTLVDMGATCVAYEIRERGIAPLARWLHQSRAFGTILIPTVLRALLATLAEDEVFTSLRFVMLSGETATSEDVASLRAHLSPDAVVYNAFGLTEAGAVALLTIDSRTQLPSGPLAAGVPFPSVRVAVVDEFGVPVADGERGEIQVDGNYATGYWRRPELTARVFTDLGDGTYRIRTGDLGRFRPDGVLEHFGRLDDVVKIAGNRVALGEVEAALRRLDGVAAAAVTTYEDASGSTRLTGFVVADDGRRLEPFVLRAALARALPGSMLPDAIGVLDEMPRLANGKLDRRQLPTRAALSHPGSGSAPTTDLERALTLIWREVLDLERVELDDDFFALGGDSMRAARLFSAIEAQLGIDRSMALLLEAPTVRQLAAAIEADERQLGLLVVVHPYGDREPLFVVHDGVGDVFYATRLSGHLGANQPIYAIQPALEQPADTPETSIEQLASRYLGEVRRVRPHGPYLLYGYSIGGLIAYEIARQLQRAGEDVVFLGLGDSPPPRSAWHQRARGRLAEITDLDGPAALKRTGELLRAQLHHGTALVRSRRDHLAEADISGSASLPLDRVERGRYMMSHYRGAVDAYRPDTPFRGSVLLVRAGPADYRPDRGWTPYVTGEVVTHQVDCDHGVLAREPHAREVAAILDAALAKLRRVDAAAAP